MSKGIPKSAIDALPKMKRSELDAYFKKLNKKTLKKSSQKYLPSEEEKCAGDIGEENFLEERKHSESDKMKPSLDGS